MKQGNTCEFLETIEAQDAYVHYHGRFFFVNAVARSRQQTGRRVRVLRCTSLNVTTVLQSQTSVP